VTPELRPFFPWGVLSVLALMPTIILRLLKMARKMDEDRDQRKLRRKRRRKRRRRMGGSKGPSFTNEPFFSEQRDVYRYPEEFFRQIKQPETIEEVAKPPARKFRKLEE
jgi:hypothetical protein